MSIDWSDPKAKISNHFTVKEACWLPSWGKLHDPSDEEKENILKTAEMMDRVRDFLGKPISIHCWIRPKPYNDLVHGAPASMHLTGLAVDFDCGEDCDLTRSKLLPQLSIFGVRMEDMPKGPWVHLDLKHVSDDKYRYFKP